MKVISQADLFGIVEHINTLLTGAQLQEVFLQGDRLVLGFYLKQSFYLVFDIDSTRPFVGAFPERSPIAKSKDKKPVSLFLTAYAEGKRFVSASLAEELGRALKIQLGPPEARTEILFTLIPGFVNLSVRYEEKTLHWDKPKEIPSHNPSGEALPQAREVEEITAEWLTKVQKRNSSLQGEDPEVVWQKQKTKDISKKQNALVSIEESLHLMTPDFYRKLGEKIKTLPSFPQGLLPEEIKELDLKKTSSENLQKCFDKAKQQEQKRLGALEHLENLKEQIQQLEVQTYSDFLKNKKAKPHVPKVNLPQMRTRKKALSSGAFVLVGKTGEDNLQLLRQARAWDYWFHMRDYPGAHAILFRERNQQISEAEWGIALDFLAEEILPKKSSFSGAKFEVIRTECRFVKALKGEKPGRVTYTNTSILTLIMK